MLNISKYGKLILVFLVFLVIMTGSFIFLYTKYTTTTQEVHKITYDTLILNKIETINNFIEALKYELGTELFDKLISSSHQRDKSEKILSILRTHEISFLYMLRYKESTDGLKLYYILDTTKNEDDRGYFGQPFSLSSNIWAKVKETKAHQVHYQDKVDSLWITLAVPVFKGDEVVAVVAVDFKNEAQESINKVIEPLKILYIYFAVFILVLLIAAYFQFIVYYKTQKRSLIDPLTKAYNRQYLNLFVSNYKLDEYQVLMLDIDLFKNVNDTYGHDIGDIVLFASSQRVNSIIRKKDVLIRYGGEEFLLFLYKADLKYSLVVANRILQTIGNTPIKAKENLINITISIGINPFPCKAKNIESAIKIADEQLYKAKENGRNRIEVANFSEAH